jgi:pimeloyl-ACP methyl ester carboxylesterase
MGPPARNASPAGVVAASVPREPRHTDAVEAWLSTAEATAAAAAARPVTAGTEKLVVWNGGAPHCAELALVFIHGYTGSRQSLAPVPGQVAGRLEANVFYTRLSGGGLGADVIGGVTLADWQRDVAEAGRVGAVIGRRVVVVGMSTGCPLAAWWVAQHPETAALVMLSPNFWPRNRGVSLLLTPAGPLLARLLVGRYRDLSGRSELEDRYWTTRHHSRSLIPMMQAVQLGRRAPLEQIRCPVLVVYTEQDRAVSVAAIKRAYERLGSTRKRLRELPAAEHHELAGAIQAPATVPALTRLITRFLQEELIR